MLDNRGYGCIHRLQQACGGEGFNNLFDDCVQGPMGAPAIDFAAHARSLGAHAEHVGSIAELEAALARGARRGPHVRRRHRYRPAALDRGRRLVVGGRRSRGVGVAKRARRARRLRRGQEGQQRP